MYWNLNQKWYLNKEIIQIHWKKLNSGKTKWKIWIQFISNSNLKESKKSLNSLIKIKVHTPIHLKNYRRRYKKQEEKQMITTNSWQLSNHYFWSWQILDLTSKIYMNYFYQLCILYYLFGRIQTIIIRLLD